MNRNVLLAVLLCTNVEFSIADEHRAMVNYQLNCQGCHTPDGSGHEGRNIPTLNDYMGKFLRVDGGREFLIQVPGASQSLLNDNQLAELTNWMIKSFDPKSVDSDFVPYTEKEVHQLRKVKVLDFSGTRAALVEKIEGQTTN